MTKTLKEYISVLENPVDIEAVASRLQFLPTTKKDLTYSPVKSEITQDNLDRMPRLSFGRSGEEFMLQTVTADGHETQKAVAPGDVIVSGPSGEKYNIGGESKLLKNYPVDAGRGRRKPDTTTQRMVARYTGTEPVSFVASWGEAMILKPGDYLVREAEGKYYRIAAHEYNQTYNQPGR